MDTSQGILVKRVKPGKDKKHILIVSDDNDYDPFELSCADICSIALIVGVIRLMAEYNESFLRKKSGIYIC